MPNTTQHITIATADDWQPLANQVAQWLQPGDVVALNGPLGAGKTTFVQALGRALGVTSPVTSPTFVLLQDYPTLRFPMLHADLYRLGPEQSDEVADELLSAIDEGQGVVLVEWAEYGPYLDNLVSLTVEITHAPNTTAPTGRHVTLTSQRALVINGD
jgi:tRNA threonylcarbamoyladenosine biosynthesis protein TsaE